MIINSPRIPHTINTLTQAKPNNSITPPWPPPPEDAGLKQQRIAIEAIEKTPKRNRWEKALPLANNYSVRPGKEKEIAKKEARNIAASNE